jgi:hypothetical protein
MNYKQVFGKSKGNLIASSARGSGDKINLDLESPPLIESSAFAAPGVGGSNIYMH